MMHAVKEKNAETCVQKNATNTTAVLDFVQQISIQPPIRLYETRHYICKYRNFNLYQLIVCREVITSCQIYWNQWSEMWRHVADNDVVSLATDNGECV